MGGVYALSFKLEFQGHLSRFLRGQGLDVHRVTRYWIEYVPEDDRGRICVTFLNSVNEEELALLPADLGAFIDALS